MRAFRAVSTIVAVVLGGGTAIANDLSTTLPQKVEVVGIHPRDGASYVLYGESHCPYPPTLASGHVYMTAGGLTGCWSGKSKPKTVKGIEPEDIGECALCLHFQP